MVSPRQIPVQHLLRPWPGRGMRAASLVLTCVFLMACSTSYHSSARLVADLPPLQRDNDIVSVGDVHARAQKNRNSKWLFIRLLVRVHTRRDTL
jgi:hypothetical protein